MNREITLGLIIVTMVFAIGYSLGKNAGYDQAFKDMKDITPAVPVAKTTDEQCVAWLFDANMKDVKKRMCK